MNWIVAVGIMFCCSIAQYLLIRKASLAGMPLSIQNFSNFVIPLIIYIPLAIISRSSLSVTLYQLLILVVSALCFAYLGSKASFMSIKYAPNPGYSLILSKSYVVFTSLASVILFQQELTVRAMIAIGIIIGGSGLIMIDPKASHSKGVNQLWLPLSLGAFFAWGCLALSSKYLLEMGVPIYTRLFYTMIIVSACIYGEMKKEGVSVVALSYKNKLLFWMIGILFAGFNYFMQLGYALSPNVGYVNAVNAASIAFVSIGATLFFHDEWNARKFIGVVGVIIGLIVLVV